MIYLTRTNYRKIRRRKEREGERKRELIFWTRIVCLADRVVCFVELDEDVRMMNVSVEQASPRRNAIIDIKTVIS
jgi:hypothetical protein